MSNRMIRPFAQFLAVCSTSTLAEKLCISSVTEVIPHKRDFANVTLQSDPRAVVSQELGISHSNVFREGHRRPLVAERNQVKAIAMRLDEFHPVDGDIRGIHHVHIE